MLLTIPFVLIGTVAVGELSVGEIEAKVESSGCLELAPEFQTELSWTRIMRRDPPAHAWRLASVVIGRRAEQESATQDQVGAGQESPTQDQVRGGTSRI